MGKIGVLSFKFSMILLLVCLANLSIAFAHINGFGEQPLSKIAIHRATISLHRSASVRASPSVLGIKVISSIPFRYARRGTINY